MPRLLLALLLLLAGPAAAEVRVLAFGDSLVSGYGLPTRDGFVPQLEAWLRAHGARDVVVVNAGVAGETTAGGRARIGAALTPDIDAVLVALGGNDILLGLPVASIGANLDAILGAIDRPVLLAGLPAAPGWPKARRERLRQAYQRLADRHGARLYPSFLAGVLEGDRPRAVPALVQADGLHPNAAGVAVIVAGIGPDVLDLVADARRETAR